MSILRVVRGVPLPDVVIALRFWNSCPDMHPIHLHTVADLIARRHTLGLYCHYCDRWSEAPLERLAAEGWARTPILKLRFRCAICGGPAQRQLRPPPPAAHEYAAGWISPPPSYDPGHSSRGTFPVEHREISLFVRTIS